MMQLPFVLAVLLLFTFLTGTAIFYLARARQASRRAWGLLLARLQPLDRVNVARIALDLLEEEQAAPPLDPDAIFKLLDGMQGLAAIEQNCDVLIDLAAYVQHWYPEALQLAEELRLNAREIKWHIGRLRGAARTGHLTEQFPLYAQRAVATYYLMTRSLLVLYEGVQLPEFERLQQVL